MLLRAKISNTEDTENAEITEKKKHRSFRSEPGLKNAKDRPLWRVGGGNAEVGDVVTFF